LNSLREFAERVLGACELQADCSWEHRMSSVFRLRDASGAVWFLKRHGDLARYNAELAAYRHWVPALRNAAPQLRAFDDSLEAVILSAVPGEAVSWPADQITGPLTDRRVERHVQRQAGTVMRLLHSAQPPLPWPDFAARKVDQFERLKPAAAGLLLTRDLDRAGQEIAELHQIPAPAQVPCHHDYTPRNWLASANVLYVIDFEWSGLDAWVADLARLYLGVWATRPDLREAFLEGYGEDLSLAAERILRGCAVLTGVWLVVRAHEARRQSFEDASRLSLLRLLDRVP
jgi:Ser/Thr protein kinase RdoA (MazF antagonist)